MFLLAFFGAMVLPPGFLMAQLPDSLRTEVIYSMSLDDLMNIEVTTASKVPQQMRETPATIRIITAEQIRQRGYQTLEQALADLPGMQFRNINGFNTYTFMRGLPSQNNLILLMVDGVQINELNSGGFYGGGQFDLTNTERIEVLYGPSSALYGTNAVSGIINIITRKPQDRKSGYLSGSLGNFGTSGLDFSYEDTYHSDTVGFRVAGMYKTTEKADLRGSKGDNNWSDNMENFEHDYALNGFVKVKNFTAGITTQLKQSPMTTYYKSTGTSYLDRGTFWNIWFLNGFADYVYDRKKTWSNRTRFYFRNSTVLDNTINKVIKADSSQPGDQVGYYRPNWLVGIEDQFNFFPVKQLLFVGGITYEHEALSEGFSQSHSGNQDVNPPPPPKPNSLHNDLLSLYVQGQWWFLRYFELMAGVRQDFSSYYDKAFTPRGALVFNMGDFTAKAMYSSAYRAPRPWDYSAGTGNPDLKPEKIQSAECMVSYRLAEVLNLELSVFRNWASQLIVIGYTDTLGNWRWQNNKKVTTTGLEAGVTLKTNRYGVFAYYTYNKPIDQDGKMIDEISEHVANGGFNVRIYKGLNLSVSGYYYGKRTNPKMIAATGSDIIGDVFLLNGNLGWMDFHGIDLQLIMSNILNTEYYHPSNLMPDRYRQPQRTFLVRVTWNFSFNK